MTTRSTPITSLIFYPRYSRRDGKPPAPIAVWRYHEYTGSDEPVGLYYGRTDAALPNFSFHGDRFYRIFEFGMDTTEDTEQDA